jgi:hypothetical protein
MLATAIDCQVGGCRWGDPMSERCECPSSIDAFVDWDDVIERIEATS